jgi:hypothetical protein
VRADRHAAGADEHVGLEPPLERVSVRARLVGGRREPVDVGSRGRQLRREDDAVGLVDLPWLELLSGRAELRARRQDGGARAARARDLRHACSCQRAQLSRPEPLAGGDDDVATTCIASPGAHGCTRLDTLIDCHGVVTVDNILDGNDGVGARRHGRAGRDSHRLAATESTRRGPTGRDPKHDRQFARRVLRAHGEAVHRRAVERRQVDRRDRGLGQHAPPSLVQRDALGGERAHPLEHEPQRLLHREQFGHRTTLSY